MKETPPGPTSRPADHAFENTACYCTPAGQLLISPSRALAPARIAQTGTKGRIPLIATCHRKEEGCCQGLRKTTPSSKHLPTRSAARTNFLNKVRATRWSRPSTTIGTRTSGVEQSIVWYQHLEYLIDALADDTGL